MKIHIFSVKHFEDWDWTNSVEKGIGGSETSAVEMAWRLARRGHEVICYAPVPWKGEEKWRGTTWKHFKDADFTEDGLWVLYRCPSYLDKFGPIKESQPRWLMCQDAHYEYGINEERSAKLDRVIALCEEHAFYLSHVYPGLAGKIWITSNGVKLDLMREVMKKNIVRNPYKLMYASSPDRGLVVLLDIFKKAKELEPKLELHVFYGFHNINKLTEGEASWKDALIKIKRDAEKGMKQEGVIWHDRVSQNELYEHWLSSGLWVYPTDFTETSCITCMEAQAMGAIPITNPLWALKDNVGWGISIEGNVSGDKLVQARYVAEIIRAVRDPKIQDQREPMMRWARQYFNWERWVDQWECDILGMKLVGGQFVYQRKYAKGRILNVGCDTDHTEWYKEGTVNMDVTPMSPVLKMPNKYHVLHDARKPFPACIGKFDTVILGDIMEHIQAKDWRKVLKNCKDVLNPEGRVIITCPDDGDREVLKQHLQAHGNEEYAPGCCAFHTRWISREDIQKELSRVGLKEVHYQTLDYGLFEGHAVTAMVNKTELSAQEKFDLKNNIKATEDFLKTIPRLGTVVDIGAHVGGMTKMFKKYAKEVIALEPHPVLYKKLSKMFRDTKGVYAHEIALAPETGRIDLKEVSIGYGQISAVYSMDYSPISVGAISLKDLFKMMDKIDYLKVDIEGLEYEIDWDPKLLKKVKYLDLEIHDRTSDQFKNFFIPPTISKEQLLAKLKKSGFVPMEGHNSLFKKI